MLSTKQKGNLTELQCISEFVKHGYTVSIPYGEDAKYDFIVDINGELYRFQAKTATKRGNGAIKFSCRCMHYNSKGANNVKYSKNDFDYFVTYWEDKCYMIPIYECEAQKTLRLTKTKNKQTKNISLAEDYEIEKQIMLL